MRLTTRQRREKKAKQKRTAELRQAKARFTDLLTKGMPHALSVRRVLRKSTVEELEAMMPTRESMLAELRFMGWLSD